MPGKMSPLFIVILALVAIGLIYQTISSPIQLLIPVVVFGAIFLLYKFPPGRRAGGTRHRSKQAARRDPSGGSKTKARKNMPFRVIEGGKDDDNLPKYH